MSLTSKATAKLASALCRCPRAYRARRFASTSGSINLSDRSHPLMNLDDLPPFAQEALALSASDFTFFPSFASAVEQRHLLAASLSKLDRTLSSREARQLRKKHTPADHEPGTFLPAAAYAFERSHFDGVIDRYRECSLTSFPDSAPSSLLTRLYDLFEDAKSDSAEIVPSSLVAHLLHLAPEGEIKMHVDNVEASAGTILGLSLGSTRVLRLRAKLPESEETCGFEVLLPPGSVYVQRGAVRYRFEHEIPSLTTFKGVEGSVGGEQRISLMLRDRLPSGK